MASGVSSPASDCLARHFSRTVVELMSIRGTVMKTHVPPLAFRPMASGSGTDTVAGAASGQMRFAAA